MKKIVLPLLCALLLGSCHGGASHKSTTKTKAGATARGDRWMRTSIDTELAREKRGEPPSAGKKTWREYWDWRISLWRKEKKKGYEQYFFQQRKALGLPDLRSL
jgi:hypothetical protein